MKIMIINDTDNDYHFGCSGTSTAIKQELRKHGELLESHTVMDSWNGPCCPGEDFTAADFDDAEFQTRWEQANKDLITRLKEADLCVCNGEGTICGWQNRSGVRTLLYLIYYIKNTLHKKCYIINHSCFPVPSPYADTSNDVCGIYRKVYSAVDFCAVRDVYSLSILNKLGIHATLAFDCLPLYIHKQFKETITTTPKEYILLSGGVMFRNDILRFIKEELPKYRKQITKDVIFLMAKLPREAEDDNQCIKEIEAFQSSSWNTFRYGKISIYYAHSLDEWLTVIKNAKILISGRFHHSVAAHTFGTPYVVFDSNTPKTTVLRDVQGYSNTQELSKLNFLPFSK